MSPFDRIRSRRLVPAVASLKSVDDAVLLAEALLAGGLDVMEITLRHESSLECIAAIAEKVPGMSCGAGTILRTTDGGATWVSQASGTTNLLRGVSFTDEHTGTVVGDWGTILRTTDGGGS